MLISSAHDSKLLRLIRQVHKHASKKRSVNALKEECNVKDCGSVGNVDFSRLATRR